MSNKEIVDAALSDNLSNLKETFGSKMGEKLNAVLQDRKQEIAKSYFGQKA